MPMRITGMSNTGLDFDAIISDTLKPYKLKIQAQEQQKQILEWKKEQLQSILKKGTDFYEKYFSSSSSSCIYSESAYKQAVFTSSNSGVTVTGSSSSNIQNYTVTCNKIATKASATIEKAKVTDGNTIKINGQSFTLRGTSNSEIAKNLNEDIGKYNSTQSNSADKINVSARYSDLANNGIGGLVIENKTKGAITLGVSLGQVYSSEGSTVGATTEGSYATTLKSVNLKDGNILKLHDEIRGDFEVTLTGSNEEEIVSNLNNQLNGSNLTASYDSEKGVMKLKANNSGDDVSNKFTATLKSGDTESKLTVDIDDKYKQTIDKNSLNDNTALKICGNAIRVTYKDGKIDTENLNTKLKDRGIDYVEATLDSNDNLILTSKEAGKNYYFQTSIASYDNSNEKVHVEDGSDLDAVISDESGNTIHFKEGKLVNNSGEEILNSAIKLDQNNIYLDGTTFTFNDTISGDAKITGSQDTSKLQETIKNFVKDYNELLGELNQRIWETYDDDYLPLTDDQKSSMSEKQQNQWEEKAKTGLLRKDEDIRNLAENMKSIMSTIIDSTGFCLDRIGIKPINNNREGSGILSIDEETLASALANNFDEVKELFLKDQFKGDISNGGILPKLEKTLYDNFKVFDSIFNEKAGSSGIYETNSDMAKAITEKKQLIEGMNKTLKKKEDALYKKYAALETALSKAQSQQESISAWFSN